MNEPRTLKTVNMVAAPVTSACKAWIEMRPPNGLTSQQISDSYPSLIPLTPSGSTLVT